ncbi:MAG: CsgG/HfaB family protein, partial [Kiritimatiellia bacterium]|nr:CsgG/HfaB family protein [Kiritimatiellia bacterium]
MQRLHRLKTNRRGPIDPLFRAGAILALLLLVAGCASPGRRAGNKKTEPSTAPQGSRPMVAVAEFENRTTFSGTWKIQEDLAEALAIRLLESNRVTVLESQNSEGTFSLLVRKGSDLLRREGGDSRAKPRAARYLLRGTLTEFSVPGDDSGWFGAPAPRGRSGGSKARVSLQIRIDDLQTGEIIASVRAEGSASASRSAVPANYK